jgi:cysteine desulfurase
VDRLGRVDAERFTARLAESRSGGAPVALAALQSANGETGTIQPVARVAEAARAAGVPLLMDAAATVGHVRVPQEWDLLTADPAAWGAPGGVGVLAVRARTRWSAPGPSSEGTEPTPGQPFVPGVLAAAVALQAMSASRSENDAHRRELVSRIRTAAEAIGDTEVVGDPRARLPHLVTFSCLYVDGEAVVGELDRAGFSVGSGSACTASTLEPSHVLAAMGVLTHGNIRIGLPTGITAPDVGRFCAELPGAIARVRAMLGAESL